MNWAYGAVDGQEEGQSGSRRFVHGPTARGIFQSTRHALATHRICGMNGPLHRRKFVRVFFNEARNQISRTAIRSQVVVQRQMRDLARCNQPARLKSGLDSHPSRWSPTRWYVVVVQLIVEPKLHRRR
jgi:hypothetical protein